jgi:ABC-type thiamin/hydroxymethylpyrimidine transport system permease subunit
LAVFGIVSSVWCVFCGFTFLIFPDFGESIHLALFDVPLTIFEITLGFWLLFKGLSPSRIA